MRKLHIGSGRKYREGYINIDIDNFFKVDIVRDITKGLPFDDSSVDEIFTEHCLEHISPDDIHFVFREMHRVCKPGAKIEIIVPIGDGLTNFPEHKSPWNAKSWIFFTSWNIPHQTGYNFKDAGHTVNKVETELDDDRKYGEELNFKLEVIK